MSDDLLPNPARPALPAARLALQAKLMLFGLPVLLVIVLLLGSFLGLVKAPAAGQAWQVEFGPVSRAIWIYRLERLVAAAIVGAALAVAGVALQSLLRNPLASPYVLGLSSGAGVGVLIGMALARAGTGLLWANTPLLAAAGSVLSMLLVYLVAQRRGRLDPYSLLLTGVIISAFNGAIMLFINSYATRDVVTDFVRWTMGRVPESTHGHMLLGMGCLTLLGWLYLFFQAIAFNVQSLGDDVATSAGVNVNWLRLGTFLATSLLTAAAVSLAGPIGFVGLIVPHLCRLIVGPDHRVLIVVSGFGGAIFLAAADTFCRSTVLWLRGELPVGILTAFCGGPFFLYLLRKRLAEGLS